MNSHKRSARRHKNTTGKRRSFKRLAHKPVYFLSSKKRAERRRLVRSKIGKKKSFKAWYLRTHKKMYGGNNFVSTGITMDVDITTMDNIDEDMNNQYPMIKVTPDIEQPRPNLLDAAMELDLQDDYSDESDGSYQWEDSDQDGGGISYDNTLVDNVRQAIKIRRNNKYSTSAIISEEMNSRLLRYSNSPGVNVEDDVLLWKINSDKLDQPFIIHGKHDYGTMLILPPALFDKLDSDKVQVELVKGVPLIKDIQVKYDPTITEDADIQDELTKIIKYCFPVLRKGTELISSEGNKYIVDNLLGEDGLSLEIGRTIGVGDIEIPAITLLTDEAVETTKQRMIDTKMKLAEAKQQEEIRGEMMRARMEEEERNRRQAEFDASHRAVATSADRPSSANLTLAQLREENMRLRKEAMERQSKKQ